MRLNTVHFFLFSKYFSLCYTVILRTLSLYLSILIQSCLRSSKKAPISNVADCNQSILPISIIVIHFINDFDVLFCFIYLFSSSSLFSFFLHTNILLFSFQADVLYKIVKYVQLFSLVLWFICFFHASIWIQLRHLHFHFICLPLYRCFVTHDYLYTNTSFFSVLRFSVLRFSVLRFTFFRFR